MLEPDKTFKESSRLPLAPILIGVFTVAAAGGVAFYWQQAGRESAEVVLTDEARAYLSNLDLSDVAMEANEDSLGQTLLEITGNISNLGDREAASIEVNCVFRDIDGLEIERQLSAPVNRRSGPLGPGETQPFRMAFDRVPLGWNQILPDLYIAQIRFSE